VLDTSAALALIYDEPGANKVRAALTGASMSTINVAEVLTVLIRHGIPEPQAIGLLQRLGLTVRDFATDHAIVAARLHTVKAEARRISLGDRACLATAIALGVPAVTADRNWQV
jgi:PIN domain nuclease of toxin-antitoxin system